MIFYIILMIKKVFTTCFLQTDNRTYLPFFIILESIVLYFRQVFNRILTGFPCYAKYRSSCFIKVFRKKTSEINSFFSFLNIILLFIFFFLTCFFSEMYFLFYRFLTISISITKYYFPILPLRFTISVSD
jgi:hypothetical protein